MSATLQQISSATGVSTRTVSRILRMTDGSPHRAETRQRVMEAARALGYRPNAAARAARTGRFNAVAMLVGRRQEQTYLRSGLLDGIYDVLEQRDLHLTLARIPDESLTDDRFMPKLLREWMADGLLVNYVYDFPPRMMELLERHELPSVWINARREADCVYPDNAAASAEATRRLLSLGHRRIGYVSLDHLPGDDLARQHFGAADRWTGYATTMIDAGLSPRHLGSVAPEGMAGWAAAVQSLLGAEDRPSAVLAATENDAAAVLLGAARAGISVPEQLSIVTFAGGLFISSGVAVESMVLDRRAMGALATELLLQKIENPKDKLPPGTVTLTHRAGSTVGPVN